LRGGFVVRSKIDNHAVVHDGIDSIFHSADGLWLLEKE
jgi:hypothetical protein